MDAELSFVFSRPETTDAVTRGAARLLVALGYAPLAEVSLPIAIVEVKSSVEDYRTDRKWGEYAPFCESFYFAVSPHFPRDILPEGPGLIVADAFGGAVLVEPPVFAMAPARRKALTLAFARLAAMRAVMI